MSSLRTGSGRVVATEARWLAHFWQRGRGWIGRTAQAPLALGIPLTPGERVHTLAVRFPLDLAYCDATGCVLLRLTLAPGRIGPSVPGAIVVWELVAGALEGLVEGELLQWDV